MNLEQTKEIDKKVNAIKEVVAQRCGYNIEMPTKWDYAMTMTHRTKLQLRMYDAVIKIIAIDANYHLPNSNKPIK